MFTTLKKYLLLLLLASVFFINSVSAITCEYPNIGLNITYDHSNNSFTVDYDSFEGKDGYSNFLLFKYGQSKYSTDELKINQELFKKHGGYACPTGMYVCEYYHGSLDLPSIKNLGYTIQNIFTGAFNEESYALLSLNEKTLFIFTQEEYENSKMPRYEGGYWSDSMDEAGLDAMEDAVEATGSKVWGGVVYFFAGVWSIVPDTITGDGVELLFRKESSCNVAEYNGPYTPININCAQLTQKMYQYQEAVVEYSNCGTDYCKADSINNINKIEDGIKDYCSNVLQEYDYTGGQAGCIDTCLTIKETLNSFREGTDLYDDGSNVGECNVSARLLVWVSNILRWIKYILPVLVVVLGILDFIKAIGSDKDDEMKKAQGRFIKRLIAAALVFLIPLILEFVLDKMGFGYNDCGLF